MTKLLILILVFPLMSHAEKLIVGINEAIVAHHYSPTTRNKIRSALNSTGLDLEFQALPGERILLSLARGDIAIATYRQARAMKEFPHLIQIQPAIEKRELFLFTTPSKSALCQSETKALSKLSIAGILGARFFPAFVYPNFGSHSEVLSLEAAMKIVDVNRADFGLWSIEGILKTKSDNGLNVHICDEAPYLTLAFFSYIHPKYAFAIPKIEAAYRKEFPPKL